MRFVPPLFTWRFLWRFNKSIGFLFIFSKTLWHREKQEKNFLCKTHKKKKKLNGKIKWEVFKEAVKAFVDVDAGGTIKAPRSSPKFKVFFFWFQQHSLLEFHFIRSASSDEVYKTEKDARPCSPHPLIPILSSSTGVRAQKEGERKNFW